MKNTDLFVAVIEQPFYGGSLVMLGRPLKDYLEAELKNCPHGVFDCESLIEEPTGGYLAVIYSDMPLVTEERLNAIIRTMRTKGIPRLGIGKGYIKNMDSENNRQNYTLFSDDFISVKDASSLNIVYNNLKQLSIARCLAAGAIIYGAPEIDFTVTVGRDAVIEEGCKLKGGTVVKPEAVIGSGSEITDSVIMEKAYIRHSVVEGSVIGRGTKVGAFALIRGGTEVGDGCRIGDFVEIKNSVLGAGVKAAHLAYIGDAKLGDNVNVGCGSVFCNYNGKIKQRTEVGDNVFIGANVNLVAPLTVKSNCYIAAGTTVTDGLEENQFCIGRVRQSSKPRKD